MAIKMNLCHCILSSWLALFFSSTLALAQTSSETIIRPLDDNSESKNQSSEAIIKPLQETEACRYKVWYLEVCDPVEKEQVVHLILADGGNNCEIVRHLTRDCVPSKENDHPVMPEKAVFKELLLSKNHTIEALEETLNKTNSTELPNMLKPGSKQLKENEVKLMDEIKEFEREEGKIVQELEETIMQQQQQIMLNSSSNSTSAVPSGKKTIKKLFVEEANPEQESSSEKAGVTVEDAMDRFEKEMLESEKFSDLQEQKEAQNHVIIEEPKQFKEKPKVTNEEPPQPNEPGAPKEEPNEEPQEPNEVQKEPKEENQELNENPLNTKETFKESQEPKEVQQKYAKQSEHNLEHLTYEANPRWEQNQPYSEDAQKSYYKAKDKSDSNTVYKDSSLGEDTQDGLTLADLMNSKSMSKSGNSNKVVNWMIKNMPEGKQTIIVL